MKTTRVLKMMSILLLAFVTFEVRAETVWADGDASYGCTNQYCPNFIMRAACKREAKAEAKENAEAYCLENGGRPGSVLKTIYSNLDVDENSPLDDFSKDIDCDATVYIDCRLKKN